MDNFKKTIVPILLTGIWINIFETARWLLLIEDYWIEYYENLNLSFPVGPINGFIWLGWGFCFATIIFVLSKKFSLLQTTLLSWFAIFVMLWIVLFNINILPITILWIVIPMSLFETFIGALICKKLERQ